MGKWRLGMSLVLNASLLGCSGGAGAGEGQEPGSAISLQLGATGRSGAHYRLSPATFTVSNSWDFEGQMPVAVIEAGTEDTINVPLPPASYNVALSPGWKLQQVNADDSLTPVVATLISDASAYANVTPYRTTPVNFAFHLGESGIDIGLTVDEGLLGYDGQIGSFSNGSSIQYDIAWANGGSSCCWPSIEALKADYPGKKLLLPGE